ncbi:hypothetical protein F2Q68_00010964 [Brassica cretica]|uniref:Uncharacterized protein n=1 Tax=Brassica cretica TaxID=69181 RepID=A0A8S9KTZ8_BRACR|nr:hypothetical protein F2Q68_00010964 [Brassica cretica]
MVEMLYCVKYLRVSACGCGSGSRLWLNSNSLSTVVISHPPAQYCTSRAVPAIRPVRQEL